MSSERMNAFKNSKKLIQKERIFHKFRRNFLKKEKKITFDRKKSSIKKFIFL